ncbi:caspase family protein [Streptomyces sp. DSM 44915]|uniref:Caspase family protein n=1 Tax=Streptomyces chisholmiae TaxID=3075540 RepID=A0ABU2JVV6_9ACTN|nr:caspase family protein [Streptomyces sp. DSM 44915]MDT0269130.1 caspase family protein [Streptomyces sp. DSM 44915]
MGRRFFIGFGSGRYQRLGEDEQLPSVPADLRAMARLFDRLGYAAVLPGLGEYDGADQVRQKLRHWTTDAELTDDDVVVMYFAGHGSVEERDRHYLLCWDSDDTDLAATALATEDLVRIVCKGGLRHLLLILDTCAGGAGSAEAAALALQTIAYRNTGGGTATGMWFLASARRRDIAEDGAFVATFQAALETTTGRTGQRQKYLDLTELVKAVNEGFDAEGRGQRAELASGLVTGLAPFLPNSGYREELPPLGTDLEVQRRVVARDLAEHFGPRSRGVEFESEQGLYFSGRVRVLSELVDWLTAPEEDGRGRVVTGSPGCGKSAVLGRVVALSDGPYRARLDLRDVDPRTVVPAGCVTAAVHARHKRLEEIVERIATAIDAEADGAAALLQELTRRGRQGPPLVIVVDAVDEAGSDTAADAGGHGEPRRITRELLRPMAEIRGVRLLVGTRHELVAPLGPTFTCLDLDQPGYRAAEDDVAGYVGRVLLASDEPDVPTPYRNRPALAAEVARGVARKAAGVYLYARTTARTLRSDRVAVDVTRPGWADALPSEVGEAFDDYLARFGPDEQRVRRMLLALAFSEGKGLPRGRVWTTLSTVLSGVPCTEEDVSWVLDVAEAYIAEVIDDDRRSAYRLYHKALAEHLRATADRPARAVQQASVEALLSLVPGTAQGRRDWFAAAPYVRQHLATHAAEAGVLDALVEDPGFLLASDPLALLRAFAATEGAGVRQVRGAYEQVAHRLHGDRPLGERAADLQLSARRCGADQLAERIDDLAIDLPWTACWAWWSTSGVHRLLSGHTKAVGSVAVGDLDGRPIAVTGGVDGTARVWDLVSQRGIGEPLPVGVAVSAIAIGDLGDYTVALTGGEDGTVRVWDLSAGQELGDPLRGHTNSVTSVAVGALDGHPVVLTGSEDGTARLWDLATRRQLGAELAAHRRTVRDVDLGELAGRPVAVTGGDDKAVHVWDLGEVLAGGDARLDGAPLIGPAGAITAVSLAQLDGMTVALVGDDTGMLGRWDLGARRQLGESVPAHVYYVGSGVASAVVGEYGGRPVALTAGRREARLWDLRTLQQLGPPLRGHVADINAGALTARSDTALAVTVGDDRTARIWDLTADQPWEGHTGAVSSLAVAEFGGRSLAVTGGEDGSAELWDLETGQCVGQQSMDLHAGAVPAIALGGVASSLVAATGGADTLLQLWDPFRGVPLGPPLRGHTNAVRALRFVSWDGTPVMVSGSEDGTVRLWELPSGTPVREPLTGHIGGVRDLAVRSVGRGLEIVVATTLDHAYHWRLTAPEDPQPNCPQAHFNVEDLNPLAVALGVAWHEGRPLVLAKVGDSNVHAYDVASRERVGGPYQGHTDYVRSACVGAIGRRPVVAALTGTSTVCVWDLASAERLGPLLEAPSHGRFSEFGWPAPVFGRAAGVPVAVIAGQRDVRVWDLRAMVPRGEPLCGADRSLTSVEIVHSRGTGVVVTSSADGVTRTHALDTGAQVAAHLTTAQDPLLEVRVVDTPEEPLVVRGAWRDTQVWGLTSRRLRGRRMGTAWSVTAHPMGDTVVVVSADSEFLVQAWELATQRPVCPPLAGHTAQVTALRTAVVDQVHTLASASRDGTVRLWDLATGTPLDAPLAGQELGAFAVEFTRLDGRDVLVTGAGDGRLRVYDVADRSELAVELPPFPGAVRDVRAAEVPGAPVLVAADSYGLLRVWDTRSPSWTMELDIGSAVSGIAVDDAGRVAVATAMGGVLLRLNLTGVENGSAS